MFAHWHALDIFFVILGCYFVIRGIFRGFIGEAITLLGLVCSIYLSFKFSGTLGTVLESILGMNSYLAQFIAIIIVWLLTTIIIAIFRSAFKSVISAASMGGMDKLLGFFSGLIKTALVIYVVLISGFLLSPVASPTWMSSSDILRYSGRHWPTVRHLLVDFKLFPNASSLPEGTLEEILRPYRTGSNYPKNEMEH
ncbi:MAG: CvpA family protein [Synergistaceae bacterium]|nr:CvpA family protein [Synergistaceae bacterium]